jgi:ABC-type glycerol-3-phosphate transport system substrate-binding protein
MIKKHKIAYYTKDYLDNDFASGRFAMFFATSPHYAYLKNMLNFNIGVAPIPEGKVKTAPIAGTNLAVFKTGVSERQNACWKFIKWLVKPTQVAKWSIGTSYLPVRKTALNEKNMKLYLLNNKEELVGISGLNFAICDPRVKIWNETRIFLAEAVEKALLEKLTPEEALNEAAYKINILLK